jgi:hypothetical protein
VDHAKRDIGAPGGNFVVTEQREMSGVRPHDGERQSEHADRSRVDSAENGISTERGGASAASAPSPGLEREAEHVEQDLGESDQFGVEEERGHAPPSSILEKVLMLRQATQIRELDDRVSGPRQQLPPPTIERER